MADDFLAEQLAAIAYVARHGASAPTFGDQAADVRAEYLSAADAQIAWLAARGRLVPEGARPETEYGVRCEPPDAVSGYADFGPYDDMLTAQRWAKQLGTRSRTATVTSRVTTRWEPVPAQPQEAPDA